MINFVITNLLLGVGLAMDTFSVSIVNTLNEPNMSKKKMSFMSLVYAVFQAIMPLIGWFCVHTIIEYFKVVQPYIPWIAFILLLYIGGKMLLEGLGIIKEDEKADDGSVKLTFSVLMVQGIATAIDALSVGFTIAEYDALTAILAAVIIAAVTFIISMIGALIGKKIGDKVSEKASILGGLILIFIGIKICFF